MSPLRALLDAVPPRGLSKYDFLGSLLRGMLSADMDAPGASKYDAVSHCTQVGSLAPN